MKEHKLKPMSADTIQKPIPARRRTKKDTSAEPHAATNEAINQPNTLDAPNGDSQQVVQTFLKRTHGLMNSTGQSAAFGAPGIEPRWTSSAKDGLGTAYHSSCRLWFTLSHGIVNEIYYQIGRASCRERV